MLYRPERCSSQIFLRFENAATDRGDCPATYNRSSQVSEAFGLRGALSDSCCRVKGCRSDRFVSLFHADSDAILRRTVGCQTEVSMAAASHSSATCRQDTFASPIAEREGVEILPVRISNSLRSANNMRFEGLAASVAGRAALLRFLLLSDRGRFLTSLLCETSRPG